MGGRQIATQTRRRRKCRGCVPHYRGVEVRPATLGRLCARAL